jgi:nucleoside-diphosphate-sugar epimerase
MKYLLFTGASGFLGDNVLPLIRERYTVDTLGITDRDDYKIDLSTSVPVLGKRYDVVLHAAGKAHIIPKNAEEVESFFAINLEGTKNLCAALKESWLPESLIFISTVAVYGCESGSLISEDHPLDGKSPYADSKKQAESFLQQWCMENDVLLTILRPSLLAGKNPPGNLGAMIRGIEKGRYLSIASGKARKSVAMASDIAAIIPLCEKKGGIYNLCDSNNPSFRELESIISSQLGKALPLSVSKWIMVAMAFVGDLIGEKAPISTKKLAKITQSLTFTNRKIIEELGFTPSDVLSNFTIR